MDVMAENVKGTVDDMNFRHILLLNVFVIFLCFCCLQVMEFGVLFFMECQDLD